VEGDGETLRAQARKRGLYILMSPHSQGAGVAQQFAARLGTRMYEGKDAKNLTHLASAGAVVFVLVCHGLYIYIHTHMYIYTYIHTYIYVCVCVCVYIYIYIYRSVMGKRCGSCARCSRWRSRAIAWLCACLMSPSTQVSLTCC
jgi:hypothetical protein